MDLGLSRLLFPWMSQPHTSFNMGSQHDLCAAFKEGQAGISPFEDSNSNGVFATLSVHQFMDNDTSENRRESDTFSHFRVVYHGEYSPEPVEEPFG